GTWLMAAATVAHAPVEAQIEMPSPAQLELVLPTAGSVAGVITDAAGKPLPCKVAVHGRGQTPTPDFHHFNGDKRVRNLIYTLDGRFTQELPPGTYQLVITR